MQYIGDTYTHQKKTTVIDNAEVLAIQYTSFSQTYKLQSLSSDTIILAYFHIVVIALL